MAVEIAEIRGEIKALTKDVERIEQAQKECIDFQKSADRKISHSVSEIGLTRKEVQMIESFIKQHQADHNENHKTAQARQWALWMLIIATCVSSVAGLIVKLIMG